MNGKAPETGKHKFHWLNAWLDLQILVFLVHLLFVLYPLPLHPDLPGFPIRTLIVSAYLIALVGCCVFIQLWRKWAAYGYFILNVVGTLSSAVKPLWMFLTWPDAPLKDMIWMSAKSIAFTFVLLLVTWLLVRPFWKQFR
jgi:uncharacterized membrane protein YphA (DoxX/SURF4 family)